jgi:PAS domain S-box-containing protein
MLLATALESAAEGIFVTDTVGTILYVNPAFAKITGYTAEEAVGHSPRLLRSGQHDAPFYEEMWSTLAAGKVWQNTITNRRKDGQLFDADLTIAPIRDHEGRTTNYVAVERDVTERKRMIEALERAVMVKSEFTSMVSHELRTPLTAIKEGIAVVEDGTAGPVNRQQAHFLALAKRNVDRLHRLINDTLDFSKLERGEFRLNRSSNDLQALVRDIVLQQQLPAEKQGLRLSLLAEEELPALPLDPDRISQVLTNLISNAIQYCPKGQIEVVTGRRGDEAVVQVRDNGPGIPTDELENIFNAFTQLSTGPGRRVGGTGLGLAICQRIVELHGGRIWAESEIGHGAAFLFTLPLTSGSEAPGS